MGRPPIKGLTDHELAIMKILWERCPLTVAEILESWPRDAKPAYTSLLTAVRAMEQKGYLTHKKQGKAYYYSARLQKHHYRNSQLKRLLKGLFDGNAYDLAVNLLREEALNEDEVQRLRRVLEEL